jgi:hypothetical protein
MGMAILATFLIHKTRQDDLKEKKFQKRIKYYMKHGKEKSDKEEGSQGL